MPSPSDDLATTPRPDGPAAPAGGESTVRSDLGKLVRLATPLALAQLAQNGMNFVDTLMVGRLGPTSLAGLALAVTISSGVFIMLMAVLLAVSPLVAQAVGARRQAEAGRYASQGLILAAFLALPGIAIFLLAGPLLLKVGLPVDSAQLAGEYLRAFAPGLPFALSFVALRGLLEGHGDARPILYIAICAVGANVFLNDAFIFGKYGLPALGMVGTGHATAIVYALMFAAAVVLVRARYRHEAVFAGARRPDLARVGEIFRLGWPIAAMLGLETGTFTVASLLMAGFGEVVLAGHQVAVQSASLAFMVPLGIASATAVLVGQAAGRGDGLGVRRSGYLGIGMATAFMACTALLFWFAPGVVISAYLDVSAPENAELIPWATAFLAIAAMFQLADGIQATAQGALRGLKDTRVPMLLTVVAYWVVGVPVGLVLAFLLGVGPQGLWYGMVAGLATAAGLLAARFVRSSGKGLRRGPQMADDVSLTATEVV